MNLQIIHTKTALIKTKIFNHTPRNRNNNRKWNPSKGFLHHKLRIQKLCKQKDSFINKEQFFMNSISKIMQKYIGPLLKNQQKWDITI